MKKNKLYKQYLPKSTLNLLEQWYNNFSFKEKYNEAYINIHLDIQNGNYKSLNKNEKQMLENLFKNPIINEKNILYYYTNFPSLKCEDVIWTEIDFNLNNFNFDYADKIFAKFKYEVNESDYLKRKTHYIEEYNKKIKKEALDSIINSLSNYNFKKAESEYYKNKDMLKYDTYIYYKSKAKKEYSIILTEKLNCYIENQQFDKADIFYKNNKEFIDIKEYFYLNDKYIQKASESLWSLIIDFLEKNDFVNADYIQEKTSFYIDIKQYLEKKQLYLNRKKIWELILFYLENYNFKKADSIIADHFEFEDFFNRVDYKSQKIYYIQKYFSSNFKDGKNKLLLDYQQSTAVSYNGKNLLVKAKAGSGKTRVLISKFLFLLEKEHLSPQSLIILTFNKSVTLEISERINNILEKSNKSLKNIQSNPVQTFHKLANNYAFNTGEILATDRTNFIRLLISHMEKTNPSFKRDFYNFIREENLPLKNERFKNPEEYYMYLRNHKEKTLNGELVKSKGEKWIADFLFEHGIDYFYEYSFYILKIKPDDILHSDDFKKNCINFIKEFGKEKTKPDFYLKKYNLVWEHWGIDENEKSPEIKLEFYKKFGLFWQNYKNDMEWKRKFWKKWRSVLSDAKHLESIKKVKKLIETSVSDMDCTRNEFEEKLKNILEAEGIPVVKRSEQEIHNIVWNNSIDSFVTLIESFINRYQQKYFDKADLFNYEIEKYKTNNKVSTFLKLGLSVFTAYESVLYSPNKKSTFEKYSQYNTDFNQLLVNAIENIESGILDSKIQKLEYILIDEYQDFSDLFFRLINSIMNRNPNIKLFCVGDDWQAINRFSGSDTKFFNSFNEFFPDNEVIEIQSNYRSGKEIVKKTNNFMKRNYFKGENAIAFNTSLKSEFKIEYVDKEFIDLKLSSTKTNDIFLNQFSQNSNRLISAKYLKKCFEIIKDNLYKEVLILHRNNIFKETIDLSDFLLKLKNVLVQEKIIPSKDAYNKYIDIKTIHSSKGLEADIVIILEVNNGIIPMFHPNNELFEIFGEDINTNIDDQKRLFYVAITRSKEKLYILCEKDAKSSFLDYLID